MLVLNNKQVKSLLSYELCIDEMQKVMMSVSQGNAIQPMRNAIHLPDRPALMGGMYGYAKLDEPSVDSGSVAALGVKLISVFPVPGEQGRTRHDGAVIMFDSDKGGIKAIIEAGEVTAIRTPCATAAATKALARQDSKTLAILGSGEQAKGHLKAISQCFDLEKVYIWSKTPGRAQAFKESQPEELRNMIEVMNSVEEAVANADIVCTTTSAADPILEYRWLKPGAHVNSIGSSMPSQSEIDIETVSQSSYFVDHKETIKIQGGEYQRALKAQAISENHIKAEVGEVLLGNHPGRTSNDEITVYKSVGIVAYDLAAAQLVYGQAIKNGLGENIELLVE